MPEPNKSQSAGNEAGEDTDLALHFGLCILHDAVSKKYVDMTNMLFSTK